MSTRERYATLGNRLRRKTSGRSGETSFGVCRTLVRRTNESRTLCGGKEEQSKTNGVRATIKRNWTRRYILLLCVRAFAIPPAAAINNARSTCLCQTPPAAVYRINAVILYILLAFATAANYSGWIDPLDDFNDSNSVGIPLSSPYNMCGLPVRLRSPLTRRPYIELSSCFEGRT